MDSSSSIVVSFPAIVGAVLLTMRKSRGLSQAEMAAAVGVNASTWSRVENGDAAVTLEQLVQASAALEVSASSVLQEAERLYVRLKEEGISTSTSRWNTSASTNLGALPLAGATLVGLLMPFGLGAIGSIAAAAVATYLAAKKKDE